MRKAEASRQLSRERQRELSRGDNHDHHQAGFADAGRFCAAWARQWRCRSWMRWCLRSRREPPSRLRRLGFIYIPNGTIQPMWVPADDGEELRVVADPEPARPGARSHHRAERTGAPAGRQLRRRQRRSRARNRRVAHRRARVGSRTRRRRRRSAGDHRRSNRRPEIGKDTRLPSLELSLESPTQIGCDTEDCFFSNTISWKSPTTPLPMEAHPRMVFERLFGQASTAAERRRPDSEDRQHSRLGARRSRRAAENAGLGRSREAH